MTDMITIGKWTVDLDAFKYEDFFVGKETVMMTTGPNGEQEERPRYIYDHESYYAALRLKQDKDKREHRDRLIEAFKKRGIATARIEFSGGNDEGGADVIVFFDADNQQMDIDCDYISSHRNIDGKWQEVELTDAEKEQNKFVDIVEAPIYWKWGSFAGDFNVYGTLTYDINAEQYCSMDYSESTYEHYQESF